MFYFLILPSIIYFTLIATAIILNIEPLYLIRDYYQNENLKIFSGFISFIGVIIMYMNSSICIFTCFVLNKKKYRELLLPIGILSLTIASDDLFMFHERLNEKLVFLFYICILLTILITKKNIFTKLKLNYFYISIFLLGFSIFIDIVQFQIPISYDNSQIVEEYAKYMGYFTWLVFWSKNCIYLTRKNQNSKNI